MNALTPFTDGGTLVLTVRDEVAVDGPATTDGRPSTDGRGLVVVDLEADGLDEDGARAVAGHTAPGGLLAVLTRCSHHNRTGDRDSDSDGGGVLVDPTAGVVTAVRAAGLAYLQHIVILADALTAEVEVTAPGTDDGQHDDSNRGRRNDGGAARVELLVFRSPPTAPPAPTAPAPTLSTAAVLRGARVPGGPVAADRARVWCTAQLNARAQRHGRYTPDSVRHPARMMPALAARAIAEFTEPGDLVADPMCGIGTTLVEAVRAGRRAVGIEYEPRWAELAQSNLDLALADGHRSAATAWALCGDARQLAAWLDPRWHGRAALVLTSPPYGKNNHGQVAKTATGVVNTDHRYSDTPGARDGANLGNVSRAGLISGFTEVLRGAALLLRPGGHVVIVVRPWRERGELVDLPGQAAACAAAAGLVVTDRAVSLLARVTPDGGLVARPSFFQNWHVARNRDRGLPTHLIAHEDILVAQLDPTCVSSA